MVGKEKFEFPGRGFHYVADKVAEADYFLELMKSKRGHAEEFGFVFSAFVSAARSVTFSLQAVMSRYPNWDQWYPPHQERLKKSPLAKFFVELRNHLQKVGGAPISHFGSSMGGEMYWGLEFIPTRDFDQVPVGDVTQLSDKYFKMLLELLRECYSDYWAYVDPRAVFTQRGLETLGWTVEDVEHALGFPRGYTNVPWPEDQKLDERLRALSRYGGDELMEAFFEKYEISADFEGNDDDCK